MKEDLASRIINLKLFLLKDPEASLHEAKGDYGTGWHYLKSFFIYTEHKLIKVDKLNEPIVKILRSTASGRLFSFFNSNKNGYLKD